MIETERYYPATPEETFEALELVVRTTLKYKSADRFSSTISFATRMSAFSSGANLSAQVIPTGEGATVRVSGTAKLRTQVGAQAAANKSVTRLLDDVSSRIQQHRDLHR